MTDRAVGHPLGLTQGHDRSAYVAGLRSVLPSGGRYFMLGFSDRQPNQWRRHHCRKRASPPPSPTGGGWTGSSHTTLGPDGIPAWLVTASRA